MLGRRKDLTKVSFKNKTTNIYLRFQSQWAASRRVSFQFLLHFLDEPLYSCSRETKSFNDLTVGQIDKKRGVFDKAVVFALKKKVRLRPPFCLVLQHLRLPGNFTGGQDLL